MDCGKDEGMKRVTPRASQKERMDCTDVSKGGRRKWYVDRRKAKKRAGRGKGKDL